MSQSSSDDESLVATQEAEAASPTQNQLEREGEEEDDDDDDDCEIENGQPAMERRSEEVHVLAEDKHDDCSDDGDQSDENDDSDDESDVSSVGEDDDVQAPADVRSNLLGVLSGAFPSQLAASPSSNMFANLGGFVESEAELSGSDASDDEQLGDSADEYEEEYNSEEEALPEDAVLETQLKKVHQKVALQDDNAEIRTFKEMLLGDAEYEDGMNSEGFFRTRRYRPAVDESSQMDLFGTAGDDSASDEGEDSQMEAARRKQRHERNAFLHEKRLNEDDNQILLEDEDSRSVYDILETSNSSSSHQVAHSTKKTPRLMKCGSFLNRSKATLKRLESQTSTALNLQGSTRGFVFKRSISNENSNPGAPSLTRKASLPKPSQVTRKAVSLDCAPDAKKRSIFRDLVQTT